MSKSRYNPDNMDEAFIKYPIMEDYRDVDMASDLLGISISDIHYLVENKEHELINMIVDRLKMEGFINDTGVKRIYESTITVDIVIKDRSSTSLEEYKKNVSFDLVHKLKGFEVKAIPLKIKEVREVFK